MELLTSNKVKLLIKIHKMLNQFTIEQIVVYYYILCNHYVNFLIMVGLGAVDRTEIYPHLVHIYIFNLNKS